MAHVPDYVRLAGYKGRSDITSREQWGDATTPFKWVARRAELDEEIEVVVEALRDLQRKPGGVPYEVWSQPVGTEPVKESVDRVRIRAVRAEDDGRSVVAELTWE
jgi:hypothetical protein